MLFVNFYSFHLLLTAKQSAYKNACICLKLNLPVGTLTKNSVKKTGKRKLNISYTVEVNSITRRHLEEENTRTTHVSIC